MEGSRELNGVHRLWWLGMDWIDYTLMNCNCFPLYLDHQNQWRNYNFFAASPRTTATAFRLLHQPPPIRNPFLTQASAHQGPSSGLDRAAVGLAASSLLDNRICHMGRRGRRRAVAREQGVIDTQRRFMHCGMNQGDR